MPPSPYGSSWCALTGNTKSLLTMFVLFSAITTTQYVAAVIAHSVALKADCGSMAVDSVSYLFNIVAECHTDRRGRARLALVMSGASLALLAYFTASFALEAARNVGLIGSSAAAEEEATVDPYIVITFAALGILFDVLSLLSYKVWHLDEAAAQQQQQKERRSSSSSSSSINMLSALLHVLSDLARSLTTFVEGVILLRAPGLDSAAIDGWSALVVCTLISFGLLGGLARWVGEAWTHCHGGGEVVLLL